MESHGACSWTLLIVSIAVCFVSALLLRSHNPFPAAAVQSILDALGLPVEIAIYFWYAHVGTRFHKR